MRASFFQQRYEKSVLQRGHRISKKWAQNLYKIGKGPKSTTGAVERSIGRGGAKGGLGWLQPPVGAKQPICRRTL